MNKPYEIPSVRDLVSPEEWRARVDLAAAYRLVALFGWDDLVFTHISVKLPGYGLSLIHISEPTRPLYIS